MRELVLNFGVNAYTGWGVVGMNICGQLANDQDFRVISKCPIDASHVVGMDPFKFSMFQKVINDSRAWQYTEDCSWIDPVGNDLASHGDGPKDLIGRVIIEKAYMADASKKLAAYDRLLTGSNWCKNIIEDATGREVKCIFEGIDPSVFYPGPRSGWFNTFNIYSSGKVEFRKAQDVVLLAFKRFSQRHPDARLITSWNSPFSDLGNGFKGKVEQPLWMNDKGQLDIKRWAHDNDIDHSKVIDLGCCPNFVIPSVLREMDVMLAPTRVESCTSLPVKEAMACGIPVIAGFHSGMKDLLTDENSLRLMRQTVIAGSSEYFFPNSDMEWYESDPEEIDEKLEWVYQNREKSRVLGMTAAKWIHENRTWKRHVEELKAWL